ncbi:CocE/NonD family hydrolase [Microvirga rosea]|uniref:CocE/NonD family hydrolase n=1 Tax=Microvirga rosea TaxID=2715425 RepID=UPI001D0B299E|nr:CocE/NonD family hydrolase [Microvirga rosea]MCB8822186.1 CocE/NonD family hydrolase [Microvirga rosea]
MTSQALRSTIASTADAVEVLSSDVVVHRDVMVRLRDGVHLATDVYRPAVDGKPVTTPLPVIMERTPYGKTQRSRSEIEPGMSQPMTRAEVAMHFVRAGFVVVYQDCRGRYNSEGTFTKYLSEGPDGYDTCAWIVDQPWCDGKIGTMGLSYAAHTQAALACLNPPGLACMVLDSGGFSSAYRTGIRQGGAFELKQLTWAYNNAKESSEAQSDPLVLKALEAEDLKSWFTVLPWSEGRSPVRWVPEYESYVLEQWRQGTFGEFWKKVGIYAEGSYETFPKVPVALLSSWYDAYVRTTFDNYGGLARDGSRPISLIMGPWLHGNRNTTSSGDAFFGENATISGNVTPSWLEFRRRWFERWLKAVENGVETEPPVRLFLMGGGTGRKTKSEKLDHGGRWIETERWPLPETEFCPFYIHGDGRLSDTPAVQGARPLSYDFDPSDPVPTIGGALTSGQPVFEGGAFDQREAPQFFGCRNPGLPLSARRDVLSFETQPLEQDLAVIGPITVDLWVSSDALDTDFTAKLIDVYPPSEDYPTGYSMILTDGILRCRYRKSWEAPELITPGEIFKITIEPFATANVFAKGHRIRLDVSSSNFPKFDVNPNTGEAEGMGRTRKVARNTVYCDAVHASRILLPCVPTGHIRNLRNI